MQKTPPKDGRKTCAFSGPAALINHIRQEARRESRTFSAEVVRLLKDGVVAKYGAEVLERLEKHGHPKG